MALTNGALINALIQHPADTGVVAITPHGTYEFDIVNVEGDLYDEAVLRLVEKPGRHLTDMMRDDWSV